MIKIILYYVIYSINKIEHASSVQINIVRRFYVIEYNILIIIYKIKHLTNIRDKIYILIYLRNPFIYFQHRADIIKVTLWNLTVTQYIYFAI